MVSLLLAVMVIPVPRDTDHSGRSRAQGRPQVVHRPGARRLPPRAGVDLPPRVADDLARRRLGGRSLLIATQLKFRMVPFADRDQFAVEIYLRPDTPLERTGAVADSVYQALRADDR